MGLSDKFGTTKTADKKKSSVVEVIASEDLATRLEAYVVADRNTKDAKAIQENLAVPIKEEMNALRINESLKIGDNVTSVKANGITLATKAQYSKIGIESETRLQELYPDRYGQFFITKSEVKLGEDALEHEEFINELIALAKAKGVSFDVKDWLIPTKAFHVARTLDEEVRAKAETVEVIKPYSPSLKV